MTGSISLRPISGRRICSEPVVSGKLFDDLLLYAIHEQHFYGRFSSCVVVRHPWRGVVCKSDPPQTLPREALIAIRPGFGRKYSCSFCNFLPKLRLKPRFAHQQGINCQRPPTAVCPLTFCRCGPARAAVEYQRHFGVVTSTSIPTSTNAPAPQSARAGFQDHVLERRRG